MGKSFSWGIQETNALKKLWPSKLPVEEIMKVFEGRTRLAVQAKACHLGLKRPNEGEFNQDYYRKLLKVIEG